LLHFQGVVAHVSQLHFQHVAGALAGRRRRRPCRRRPARGRRRWARQQARDA
jgi:hypothetical protein